MIEKLEAVLSRFNQLTELVVDPNVIARQDEWQKYTKERSDLEELVEKYLEYKKINQEKDDAEQAAESESDAADIFSTQILPVLVSISTPSNTVEKNLTSPVSTEISTFPNLNSFGIFTSPVSPSIINDEYSLPGK